MPIDTLPARANTGTGTDGLAGRATPGGFAGAVVGTNAAGDDWERLATEATLAALNAKARSPGQSSMAQSQPVVIANDQSAIPTTELPLILTGAAAQTIVVNNILEGTAGPSGTATDGFRAASVQVVSTGTAGTFIFEQSNDNANWIALPVFNAALTTGAPIAAAITATASQIIYTFPIRCRFIRLRIVTTITGGTIQAFSRLSTDPWTPAVFSVAQPTAASLQATVAGTVTANVTAGTVNPVVPATPFILNSAATTNGALILTGTSGLQAFYATNTGAAAAYVKLYNKATAPVVGTDVPAMILVVPAAVSGVPGVATLPIGFSGFRFALGLGIAITGAAADADTTAVAAGQVKVILSRTV